MTTAEKLRFYWKQSKECAVLARRLKFMRRDERAELWHERARASHMMVQILVDEMANGRRS